MYQLNFCEYNRSNQDYDRIYRPAGSGDYLFLLFKAPMKVYLEGQLIITRENACILYTPGAAQHYQAVRRFSNSYIHFSAVQRQLCSVKKDTDQMSAGAANQLIDENPARRFGVPENMVFYPENPNLIDFYISRLQKEYFSCLPFREEAVHAIVSLLFLEIARGMQGPERQEEEGGSLYPAFQKLRLDMLTNCHKDWEIEQLCQRVNLEKSQFYVYYRYFFSSTPKNDLLHARLEKAKTLLSNEALQIKEVAQLCGFRNQAHFTRYFKTSCGCSPGEYARRMIKRACPEGRLESL